MTAALALVLGTAVTGPASAADRPPAGVSVNIANLTTGLCADVPDLSAPVLDGPVTQYSCDYSGRDNQRWELQKVGSYAGEPEFLVRNDDGLCMDLPYFDRATAGTPVTTFTCLPEGDNQRFRVRSSALTGVYQLVHSLDDSLCLDVAGFGIGGNDAPLTLWPCSDTDDHLWTLRTSASDRSAGALGVVSTHGAGLVMRAEARPDAPKRGSLANKTAFRVTCVAGSGEAAWYRTPSNRYVSARYVRLRGAVPPACGGGSAEDLASRLANARTYNEVNAAWAALGRSRQGERGWQQHYAEALRRIAKKAALDNAGIDEAKWDTGRALTDAGGKDGTDHIARAAYDYYAQLFLKRPDELLWAGLGSLAGGPVYAGIQDATYCQGCKNGEDMAWRLQKMEKEIFLDLAWQHELYLSQGLAGLEAVERGQGLGAAPARNADWLGGSTSVIGAWRDIASGDRARVSRGNKVLTAVEQDAILQNDYDSMAAARKVYVNRATRTTRSPIPGSDNTFLESTEPNGWVKTPSGQVYRGSYRHAQLPMSIAYWEDRREWMLGSLFVEWDEYSQTEAALQHIRRPVAERAKEFRQFGRDWKSFKNLIKD